MAKVARVKSSVARVVPNAGNESVITPLSQPPVKGPAPTVPIASVNPKVSGKAAQFEDLTSTTGTWTGTPPITYVYQWMRDGAAIVSATGAIYEVVAVDLGKEITCRVTATNGAGSTAALSNKVFPT